MASIFSRIVAGEIPCHKVAKNSLLFWTLIRLLSVIRW